MPTAYSTLQVTEDACQEVIDAAWKALMKKFHPDANPGVDPKFATRLNLAHEILSSPMLKAIHDQKIAAYRRDRGLHGSNLMYRGPQVKITVQTGSEPALESW